jgi:hypothetical protein
MTDNLTSPSLDNFLRGRATKSENTTPEVTMNRLPDSKNIIEQTIRTKDSPGYKELQGVIKILSRATTPIKNSTLDFPFSIPTTPKNLNTVTPSSKLSSTEIFEKLVCIDQKLDYVTKTLLKIEKNHLKIHLHNHNE